MIGRSQEHCNDLLPAYVNGTLDAPIMHAVQAHLELCEQCRGELNAWRALKEATFSAAIALEPPPPARVLNQVFLKIDAPVQPVAQRSAFLSTVMLQGWQILTRQIAIIHRSIWITSALVIFGATAIALLFMLHSQLLANKHSMELFLTLVTTVSASVSVAFIYGVENDASFELTLSTPTSIRIIMLSRLLLVVGYNFALSLCASALLTVASGGGFWDLVQLWSGPMLFLSSITLTLSLFIGSWFAILAALTVEAIQALPFYFERHIPLFQLTQPMPMMTNPVMLVLAVLFIAFALFYAPRQPRLTQLQ